jgi:hexosaminidase
MEHTFKTFGTMLDCSRNAVMTAESVRRWIDLTAKLGCNTLHLYMEDTYEVDGQPYFGHLRGRYSKAELKQIDAYAAAHGMQVIPCIQTLAHVNALFHWPVYREIHDAADILLTGDERTYALVDGMFRTLRECLRTNIVNIGMDEADLLGLGKYLTLHGYRDRFSILMEHLRRVSEMAKKNGFELLMWGDMFFRLAGGDYFTNFSQNPKLGEIPEEVRQLVPENIHLVYWDYFSRDRQSYERNIDAHNAIKSGSWFAGGLWTWAGFAPHNTFSIATMREAMKACHAKGVENVVMTMWGDNGAECSKFAVLPALFTVSQMAQDIDDVETIHANFEREFGIPFEEFRALDLIGTQNDSAEAIYNPEKYLLYCDPFMGQFDNRVKSGDAAGYADCAARLAVYADHAEYGYLFRSLRALCAFLSVKADLGIRTRAAYLSGDKKAAKALCADYDAALERLDAFYAAYEQQWMHENKPQGFDVVDLRIGGQRQRLLHCRDRLLAYAEGRLDRIEELEEPVLDCCCEEKADGQATRAIFWHEIASANVI